MMENRMLIDSEWEDMEAEEEEDEMFWAAVDMEVDDRRAFE